MLKAEIDQVRTMIRNIVREEIEKAKAEILGKLKEKPKARPIKK